MSVFHYLFMQTLQVCRQMLDSLIVLICVLKLFLGTVSHCELDIQTQQRIIITNHGGTYNAQHVRRPGATHVRLMSPLGHVTHRTSLPVGKWEVVT